MKAEKVSPYCSNTLRENHKFLLFINTQPVVYILLETNRLLTFHNNRYSYHACTRTRFQYEKPKNGYDLTKITYVHVHIRKFSLSRLFVAYYKTKHTLVYSVNGLI